jgi:hypothetical protein
MGWFHRTLCGLLDEFLDDVVAKRSPRVILCSPPQFGKSELVSRRFPPYLLGRHPSLRVIATSYGSSLANDLSRDVQAIMDSNGFHKLFPVRTGWGRCSSPSRTDTNSGPPPPYRSVGGSSMNSSTGGHSESMSQRDYNACRDAGGGGGRGRR